MIVEVENRKMEAPGGDLGVQAQPDEAKQFLYQWLAKQKATPNYNVRPAGTLQLNFFVAVVNVQLLMYCFIILGRNKTTSKIFV